MPSNKSPADARVTRDCIYIRLLERELLVLTGWAFLVSVTSYRSHYKALVCYGFAAVFNLFFDYLNFGGKGTPRGSTLVQLGSELVISIGCQYKPPLYLAAICDASFDWWLPSPVWGGEGVVVSSCGVGDDGSPE